MTASLSAFVPLFLIYLESLSLKLQSNCCLFQDPTAIKIEEVAVKQLVPFVKEEMGENYLKVSG